MDDGTLAKYQIKQKEWTVDEPFITFMEQSCDISNETDVDFTESSPPVDATVLDLDWFYRDRKNFISFAQKL